MSFFALMSKKKKKKEEKMTRFDGSCKQRKSKEEKRGLGRLYIWQYHKSVDKTYE